MIISKLLKTGAVLGLVAISTSAIAQDRLVIKGSDTLGAKMVPQLAEAFKAAGNDVAFEIAAEGSSTAFSSLIDKTAQIGMSSRAAKEEEVAKAKAAGVNLDEIKVCMDSMAVIVNKDNGVKELTKEQVEGIFTGDITDWSEVGGEPGEISIYTRNTASGTFADFKNLAMAKRDYSSKSQMLAGNEQIASEVGANKAGIGYVGLAYLQADSIVPVTIDGKKVTDAGYPLSRPNFFYTDGKATGVAAKFIEFVLSPAGATIIEQVGFVPLSK